MPTPALPLAPTRPRTRALVVPLACLLAFAVLMAASDEVMAGKGSRHEQLRFMWAMAGQESGRDYYARNRSSGAFGKYQIMPFNWSDWAAKYLADPRADQTPYNQEIVAYGKLRDLYRWLGSWKRVAYWWLTGQSDKNEKRWSAYARRYVKRIMRSRAHAPARPVVMPRRTSSRATRGDWRRSGLDQKLRIAAGGRAWPSRGRVRDGQVLRVRSATTTSGGHRWIRVVTADGRLGWLKQLRTVPAHRPARPARWKDVHDRGERAIELDRSVVRPRPR